MIDIWIEIVVHSTPDPPCLCVSVCARARIAHLVWVSYLSISVCEELLYIPSHNSNTKQYFLTKTTGFKICRSIAIELISLPPFLTNEVFSLFQRGAKGPSRNDVHKWILDPPCHRLALFETIECKQRFLLSLLLK